MKKIVLSGLIAAALSASAFNALAETAPKQVTIGFQKANIFALLKYRGTLDAEFKKQGIAVSGSNSRPARRCWKG